MQLLEKVPREGAMTCPPTGPAYQDTIPNEASMEHLDHSKCRGCQHSVNDSLYQETIHAQPLQYPYHEMQRHLFSQGWDIAADKRLDVWAESQTIAELHFGYHIHFHHP